MANQKQMNQMMRQMQKMQEDMASAQQVLEAEVVEGTAGGGVVTAEVTGGGQLQKVSIDAGVVDPDDVEMLEDLVVAAVSDGLRKAQELQAERMGPIAGGVDLGGLGGMLG